MDNQKQGVDAPVQRILIVGDWVVDEYWYMVRHHSEISSHTGFVHYRSKTPHGDRVVDLCSAGHVTRVLYHLCNAKVKEHKKWGLTKQNLELWGLGNWAEPDTEPILHLIHGHSGDCEVTFAPFQIIRKLCNNPPVGVFLRSLDPSRLTTRVVRLYHSTDSGVEQLNRIDWELPPSYTIASKAPKLPSDLPDDNKSGFVTSVVIHDLCKGVIKPDLIDILLNKYKRAKWFVRTKDSQPSWIDKLAGRLELFLIGPEVAEPSNPWGTWLIGDEISYRSLSHLDRERGSATIILSDRKEVIGRINDAKECLTAKAPLTAAAGTEVGWPSALFGTLVYWLNFLVDPLDASSIEHVLDRANEYATAPVVESPTEKELSPRKPQVAIRSWQTCYEEWMQARQGFGIIFRSGESGKDEYELDVWRGSSDLPGYVACVEAKRERLNEIGRRLRVFKRGGSDVRPLSILLEADPGSGKTHLAQILAEKFGFWFIQRDITQMIHREDLLDLFDTVATEQANRPDRQVLVFVDEVNAELDSSPVYSSFLAPLEQGVYFRRGRAFSLRPCVWIFAGTNPDHIERYKSDKLSDFEQRLTTTVRLDFKSLYQSGKNSDEKAIIRRMAQLEQIYLGATMIRRRFPDVYRVSKQILKKFNDLDPAERPARRIRKLVDDLSNVQYGTVRVANLPETEGVGEQNEEFVKLNFI